MEATVYLFFVIQQIISDFRVLDSMKILLSPHQRVGRLTLVAREHRVDSRHIKRAYWRCLCDCGSNTSPAEDALKRGLTRSCGCLHRDVASAAAHDLVGRRFGRLTVIRRVGSDKSRAATWLVRCDCGKEKTIRSTGLTFALTESCGCIQREIVSLPFGMSLRNSVLRGYISSAKTRGLSWELTEQQFDLLTQSNCHYCGVPPLNIKSKKRYVGTFTYNGIDRKNNAIGYMETNVVPCCMDCNNAKSTMSYERFIAYLQRAGKFQLNREEAPTVLTLK